MPEDITAFRARQTKQPSLSGYPAHWSNPIKDQYSMDITGQGGATDIGPHNYKTWDEIAQEMTRTGSFQTATPDAIMKAWTRQNEHADRYRNDPAYRQEWDKSHGGFGNDLGKVFNAAVGGTILAGGAGELFGSGAGGSGYGDFGASGGEFGGLGAGGTLPATATATAATNALAPTATTAAGNAMNWLNPLASITSGYLSHEATGDAMDEISRQYDQTRADMAPWREAGVNALNNLTNFDTDTILNDPMYQLARDESLRAANRGNSARGMNLSGNALIDEARTAAGVATGYGSDIWNRQAGLAGIGQTTTNAMANLGANSANQLANLNLQRGQGYNNAIQGGIQNYFTQNYLDRYRA